MKYLVNLEIEEEGSANPKTWKTVVADSMEDAVTVALKRVVKRRPKQALVAKHDCPKHENGAPMVANGFSLNYSV